MRLKRQGEVKREREEMEMERWRQKLRNSGRERGGRDRKK